MKAVLLIIVIFAIGFAIRALMIWTSASAEIDYRGQQIPLTKRYLSYESYVGSSNQLAEPQIRLVEKIMTSTRVGPAFKTLDAATSMVFDLKFPGYGAWSVPVAESEGRHFNGMAIEIPQANRNRWFIFETKADGSVVLADDFVASSTPVIVKISFANGQLMYSDESAGKIRASQIEAQPGVQAELP